jgi:hypothetical protein
MWTLFAAIGAVIASLIIATPELFRLGKAMRTGVIIRKGYARTKVLRQDDPDGFQRLIQASLRDLLGPGALFLGGMAATVLQVNLFIALFKG